MRSPAPAFDLRAALSAELRAAIEELDAVATKRKAVHRCRVRIKRARALARVGRACAPGLAAVFNDSARAAMRTLAQARDIAALATIARAVALKTDKKAAAALCALGAALEASESGAASPDLHASRSALRDLLAMAQVWPEASARQIRKGAERVAERARRARRRALDSQDPARRHEWRKREKDRLYAATLLGESWPRDYKRRRRIGEALGDKLGCERDVRLLAERLEAASVSAGSAKADRRALHALKARQACLAKRADALGAHLHATGA